MTFRRLRYFLGEAVRSLLRNRLMTVASVLTVASCILMVIIFYVLAVNVSAFLEQLEGGIGITAFVDDAVDAEGLSLLNDRILEIEPVVMARYISREETLERVRALYDDPRIMAGIPAENFRRSFDITIEDLQYHTEVLDALAALEPYGLADVRHAQGLVQIITAISNTIRWFSMGLILILGAVAITIITNTIRLTVNARKTEINIMKYVGATDWFIRWPFLFEGILIGIIGSLLPLAMSWAAYPRIVAVLRESAPMIEAIPFLASHEIFVYLAPFVLLLGVLIGVVGSGTSIRRHLKV